MRFVVLLLALLCALPASVVAQSTCCSCTGGMSPMFLAVTGSLSDLQCDSLCVNLCATPSGARLAPAEPAQCIEDGMLVPPNCQTLPCNQACPAPPAPPPPPSPPPPPPPSPSPPPPPASPPPPAGPLGACRTWLFTASTNTYVCRCDQRTEADCNAQPSDSLAPVWEGPATVCTFGNGPGPSAVATHCPLCPAGFFTAVLTTTGFPVFETQLCVTETSTPGPLTQPICDSGTCGSSPSSTGPHIPVPDYNLACAEFGVTMCTPPPSPPPPPPPSPPPPPIGMECGFCTTGDAPDTYFLGMCPSAGTFGCSGPWICMTSDSNGTVGDQCSFIAPGDLCFQVGNNGKYFLSLFPFPLPPGA